MAAILSEGTLVSRTSTPTPVPLAGGAEGRRILIIDDDVTLVQGLRHSLELDGYQVRIEPRVPEGLAQAAAFRPQLVITQLRLVESEAGSLLERLRREHARLPVLVLAARSEEAVRLAGFRLGVDDFLLRPFAVTELHRRVDLMLRQSAAAVVSPPVALRFGDIEIHAASRTVRKAGQPVQLRLKEFDLLMALVARAGNVVSRVELLREVWGYRGWVATRTVDTHVAELRRKLETDPAAPRHILTIRKVGYRLER